MESKSTNKSEPSITRHMVTFTVFRNKFAPTEKHTRLVEGDINEWFDRMHTDPEIEKVVIDFALYLW